MATDTRELQRREESAPASVERPDIRQTVLPETDITERDDALLVVADMPGVAEDSVDVHVIHGVLTVEGRVEREDAAGYEVLLAEYSPSDYRRSFTLSSTVDVDKIEASMKDGVLRIVLPKVEAARARKIPVRAS